MIRIIRYRYFTLKIISDGINIFIKGWSAPKVGDYVEVQGQVTRSKNVKGKLLTKVSGVTDGIREKLAEILTQHGELLYGQNI